MTDQDPHQIVIQAGEAATIVVLHADGTKSHIKVGGYADGFEIAIEAPPHIARLYRPKESAPEEEKPR